MIMMTAQQIFDKVTEHLLTQKVQSTNEEGCAYHGEDGLCCAVGCLLPEELDTSDFEGQRASAAADLVPDVFKKAGVDVDNKEIIDLLEDLQEIHDDRLPSNWRTQLIDYAERKNLSKEVFEKFA